MDAFPTIRIDIAGVRRTLIHSLYSSLENDKKAIEKQVEEQLATVDMGQLIQEAVSLYAPRMISEAIQEAIQRSVREALWEQGEGQDALRDLVGALVIDSVKKITRRRKRK